MFLSVEDIGENDVFENLEEIHRARRVSINWSIIDNRSTEIRRNLAGEVFRKTVQVVITVYFPLEIWELV